VGPGAAKYFDLAQMSQIPAGFNGSLTITAVKTGTTTPGSIVASVMELNITGNGASAFEGVSSGATTVYMPSALCNYSGQSSFYAVQNSSTDSADVTVTYDNGLTKTATIAAGAKTSFRGCDTNASNYKGSAIITSTKDIIAVGKISGAGLSTAFVGISQGSATLALPYVRWSETQYSTGVRQHANIAIQNVGGADLAAGVEVRYYDKDGNLVGTHTLGAIAKGGKVNSNPNLVAGGSEFGYSASGTGGSAVIVGPSGSQLAVVVRISSYVPASGLTVGEDYTGIPISAAP
jgi:hypothetical protein